jgi:serine/threonine protein kinase
VGGLDELQPGDPRRIGPYWLEGRLGAGGMGRVYLGRSPGGRHVAVKAIRAELAESPDFRTRFAREVSAARRVSGIFTAPVVDADLDGPVPWLATSFVAGPSLATAVVTGGPMSAGSVLALTAGLAEGLSAIHAAGVVHRDLKPSNVIVADDGPRVLDFGISLSAEASALTQTGMVVGSPGFMSPEQADGHDVGPPTDIFSLGAVLAFAATGQGPFGTGSTAALVYRVVHSEPDTGTLPDEIRPLIERCLDKDPRHRPTAGQVLAEVSVSRPAASAWPAGANGPRPGAGSAYPATGGADVNPPPVHLATEQAGVSRSPPVGPPLSPTTTSASQPPGSGGQAAAPEPPRWSRRWLIAGAAIVVLVGSAAGAFFAARAAHVSGRPTASASQAGRAKPHPLAASAAPRSSPTTQASATTAQSSSAAVPSSGGTVMATLGSYLTQSASVRPSVQGAIDGVQTCSESPSSGQATIQQAINTRQRILSGLQTLSPSSLPHGAQLISELSAAMQNSVHADQDYQSWMADSASSGGGCASNPAQDSNYQAGTSASVQATAAKEAFLNYWNPIAPGYGQKTYTSTGF